MKIDKIFLVSIFLLAVLTLGAVSATDDVGTLTVEGDTGDAVEAVDSPVDEDNVIADDYDDWGDDDDDFGDDDDDYYDDFDEKYDVNITVSRPDVVYCGDYVRFDTKLVSDGRNVYPDEDEITVFLNGKEIYNEWGYFEVGFDELGLYEFVVKYDGDWEYNSAEYQFSYDINGSMYRITADEEVAFDEKYFELYAPVLSPNDIEVTVNGKKFKVYAVEWEEEVIDEESGEVEYDSGTSLRCDASALKYGNNTIYIYYPGDKVFAPYNGNATIMSLGYIESSDDYIDYGDDFNITIKLPADAKGTLYVYHADVIMDEDDDWDDDWDEDDEDYGDDGYDEYEDDLYGYDGYDDDDDWDDDYDDYDDEGSRVIIGDLITSAEIKDGFAVITFSDLSVGNHAFYAEFNGTYDVHSDVFEVSVNPIINVPKTILVGEDAFATIVSSPDDDGFIEVVSGDDWEDDYFVIGYGYLEDGYAEVSLAELEEGMYRINVYYYDDEDSGYSMNYYRVLYVVDEYDVTVNITQYSEQVVVNSGSIVSCVLPAYADGNLTLYVDGKLMDSIKLEHQYEFEVDDLYLNATGLSLGKHSLTVNFTSETQGTASASADFNVVAAYISIPSEIVLEGSVSANDIDVELGPASAGNVVILVDNKQYLAERVSAVDGLYKHYTLDDVACGRHDVTVTYTDDKYGVVSNSTVVDIDYTFGVNVDDVYGEDNIIYVLLPSGMGDGEFTITVDGKKIDFAPSKTVSDCLVANPSKLDIGEHIVFVKYSGDAKYPAKEYNYTFEIYGYIKYPEDDIFAGSNETISLTLPSDAEGSLHVYIYYWDDDEGYSIVVDEDIELEDGFASYLIEEFEPNSYYAQASYTGDDYDVDDEYFSFEVSSIDWGTDSVILGENKTITFVSADDEPRVLRIELYKINDPDKEADDSRYNKLIENRSISFTGNVTYTFTNLKLGEYHIFVAEEDPYDDEWVGYQGGYDFSVVPQSTSVPSDSSTYEPGAIKPLEIGLPKDAKGKIVVKVLSTDGEETVLNSKEYDVNGPITIDLNELIKDKGSYTIEYNYTDDEGNSMVDDFYVGVGDDTRNDPKIKVTASDVKAGEDVVISITSPKYLAGNITATIDGKSYDVQKGGCNITVSGLAVGKYTVSVTYGGDGAYKAVNETTQVSVLTDPVISAKDTTVMYSANGKFSVTVYGTDGKLAANTQVVFMIKGKQVGKATTNANGVATYTVKNVPGTYKITATALGKSVTKKLTVKHVVTLKTIKVKKSAKKLVLRATLAKVNGKYLKNKKVTFKFKGKKYTAKTNKKGVAKVTVKSSVLKKLKVGKKVTYQATYLKDTVKKTAKVKK